MYSCYLLTPTARTTLMQRFTPKFSKILAHHITYKFGSDEIPPLAKIEAIGHASDDKIECLIVAVNGSTVRADGSTYHITWSLDPSKAKPVMSNELLLHATRTIVDPIEIQAIPSVEQ